MEPLLIILIPGVLGGLVLALLIAFNRAFNRPRTPTIVVPRRLESPSPSLINMANIRIEGLGGLGMVAAVVAVAVSDPRIRLATIAAASTWCRACARPDRDETTHRRAAVQRRRSRRPTNAEHRRRAAAHVSRARAGNNRPGRAGQESNCPCDIRVEERFVHHKPTARDRHGLMLLPGSPASRVRRSRGV